MLTVKDLTSKVSMLETRLEEAHTKDDANQKSAVQVSLLKVEIRIVQKTMQDMKPSGTAERGRSVDVLNFMKGQLYSQEKSVVKLHDVVMSTVSHVA